MRRYALRLEDPEHVAAGIGDPCNQREADVGDAVVGLQARHVVLLG